MTGLPRTALVLALYVLLRLIAGSWPAPAPADAGLLALTAALVLLPAATLSERTATLALGCAAQAALALVPAVGPTRAAATVLALVAILALAIADRWGRPEGLFTPPAALAAALALQALCRPERLLALRLDAGTAVDLLVLPALAAAGAVGLARRRGDLAAAIVACALAAVGRGFTWETALALLAFGRPGFTAAAPSVRLAAIAAMLAIAAGLVHPVWAALLLVAAWLAEAPRVAWPHFAAATALFAVATRLAAARTWPEIVSDAAPLLLLLPCLPLAALRRPRRLAVGAVLASIVLRLLPGWEPLAAPLALLALQVPTRAASLQAAWSAGLLALATLAAAYPWRSEAALDAAVSLLIGGSGWATAVAVGLLGPALAWVAIRHRRWLVPATLTVVAVTAMVRGAAAPRQIAARGFTLTAASPAFRARLPPEGVSCVILDTYLSRGLDLAAGTPVATLTLRRPDGTLRRRVLAVGPDTADWAARREKNAAPPPAPPPWSSFVAPSGDFFGQIYRATWDPSGRLAGALWLERHHELPDPVELSVVAVAGQR